MQYTKLIKNLKEMDPFAEKFLNSLQVDKNQATVLGLYGDLGSGKTAFVKSVAKILGIKGEITSPTFVLEKFYEILKKGFPLKTLIHIDAYRLESGEDLKKIGWEEQLKDKTSLIIIEWANIVEDILPKNTQKLRFRFINENTREITYML